MIDLHLTFSPNVLKVLIMLEELGLPYRRHMVGILKGDNFTPEFLALNPIGKVPVLVDDDPAGTPPIFESGAILIYLAEKHRSELFPTTGPARWTVLSWLMMQMSLAGPMLGQVNHFQLHPSEAGSYADKRYRDQARRVYRNVDERLGSAAWLGGADYSIADIAMYPWTAYLSRHGFNPDEHPNLIAWRTRIDARPAVQRAVATMHTSLDTDPEAFMPGRPADIDRFYGRTEPGPTADMEGFASLGPMTSARP